MTLILTWYKGINLIHSTHLPLGVGIGVTKEPLAEAEDASKKCVLLFKGYEVVISTST